MYFYCKEIDFFCTQLRSDFIASEAGVSPPLSAQEECLGLAVLDLWRLAKERHQNVRELCKTVRYLYLDIVFFHFCLVLCSILRCFHSFHKQTTYCSSAATSHAFLSHIVMISRNETALNVIESEIPSSVS